MKGIGHSFSDLDIAVVFFFGGCWCLFRESTSKPTQVCVSNFKPSRINHGHVRLHGKIK
ncbi:hypothetical protein V6Z12_D12G136400 [Gossypium hirsutum]